MPSMLHHVSFYVQDYQKAKDFYLAALAPLGYHIVMEFGEVAGMGAEGKPDLWLIKKSGPLHQQHLAFAATSKELVQAFYNAALAAGGKDNGAPGPRAEYNPDYYGAFVLDPEGNNIEAVIVG